MPARLLPGRCPRRATATGSSGCASAWSLFDGSMETGPLPEGGYRVWARIPLPEMTS